jgi:hypothetical protein
MPDKELKSDQILKWQVKLFSNYYYWSDTTQLQWMYSVFQGFSKAKSANEYGGSILS